MKLPLFDDIKIGNYIHPHRIIMSALANVTKKSENDLVHYYMMRALQHDKSGASFIVSESMQLTALRLYEDTWRRVVEVVHDFKSTIFVRIYENTSNEFSASDSLNSFYTAGAKAIEYGFDGVEVDASRGILKWNLDAEPNTPYYTENYTQRAHFLIEALNEAVLGMASQECVGLRLSPGSAIEHQNDITPFYCFLLSEIAKRFPNLAYVAIDCETEVNLKELRLCYRGGSNVLVGLFDADIRRAKQFLRRNWIDAIMMGSTFDEYPDLPKRIKEGSPLNEAPSPQTFPQFL
jgi:2,4-dienoyl-CoA reductase-like NADH-dependent reductase (Old Yellow Enzyme family)